MSERQREQAVATEINKELFENGPEYIDYVDNKWKFVRGSDNRNNKNIYFVETADNDKFKVKHEVDDETRQNFITKFNGDGGIDGKERNTLSYVNGHYKWKREAYSVEQSVTTPEATKAGWFDGDHISLRRLAMLALSAGAAASANMAYQGLQKGAALQKHNYENSNQLGFFRPTNQTSLNLVKAEQAFKEGKIGEAFHYIDLGDAKTVLEHIEAPDVSQALKQAGFPSSQADVEGIYGKVKGMGIKLATMIAEDVKDEFTKGDPHSAYSPDFRAPGPTAEDMTQLLEDTTKWGRERYEDALGSEYAQGLRYISNFPNNFRSEQPANQVQHKDDGTSEEKNEGINYLIRQYEKLEEQLPEFHKNVTLQEKAVSVGHELVKDVSRYGSEQGNTYYEQNPTPQRAKVARLIRNYWEREGYKVEEYYIKFALKNGRLPKKLEVLKSYREKKLQEEWLRKTSPATDLTTSFDKYVVNPTVAVQETAINEGTTENGVQASDMPGNSEVAETGGPQDDMVYDDIVDDDTVDNKSSDLSESPGWFDRAKQYWTNWTGTRNETPALNDIDPQYDLVKDTGVYNVSYTPVQNISYTPTAPGLTQDVPIDISTAPDPIKVDNVVETAPKTKEELLREWESYGINMTNYKSELPIQFQDAINNGTSLSQEYLEMIRTRQRRDKAVAVLKFYDINVKGIGLERLPPDLVAAMKKGDLSKYSEADLKQIAKDQRESFMQNPPKTKPSGWDKKDMGKYYVLDAEGKPYKGRPECTSEFGRPVPGVWPCNSENRGGREKYARTFDIPAPHDKNGNQIDENTWAYALRNPYGHGRRLDGNPASPEEWELALEQARKCKPCEELHWDTKEEGEREVKKWEKEHQLQALNPWVEKPSQIRQKANKKFQKEVSQCMEEHTSGQVKEILEERKKALKDAAKEQQEKLLQFKAQNPVILDKPAATILNEYGRPLDSELTRITPGLALYKQSPLTLKQLSFAPQFNNEYTARFQDAFAQNVQKSSGLDISDKRPRVVLSSRFEVLPDDDIESSQEFRNVVRNADFHLQRWKEQLDKGKQLQVLPAYAPSNYGVHDPAPNLQMTPANLNAWGEPILPHYFAELEDLPLQQKQENTNVAIVKMHNGNEPDFSKHKEIEYGQGDTDVEEEEPINQTQQNKKLDTTPELDWHEEEEGLVNDMRRAKRFLTYIGQQFQRDPVAADKQANFASNPL